MAGQIRNGLYAFDSIKMTNMMLKYDNQYDVVCYNSVNTTNCNSSSKVIFTLHMLDLVMPKIKLFLFPYPIEILLINSIKFLLFVSKRKSHKLPFHVSLTVYNAPLQSIYSNIFLSILGFICYKLSHMP